MIQQNPELLHKLKTESNISKLISIIEIPPENNLVEIAYLEFIKNSNDLEEQKSDKMSMIDFHILANSGNQDECEEYLKSRAERNRRNFKMNVNTKKVTINTNEIEIDSKNIFNSLQKKITEDVISILFEAGWNSHYNTFNTKGFTLNMTSKFNKEYKNTKEYYSKEIRVPEYTDYNGKFSELDKDGNEIILDYRSIGSKVLMASNIINEKNNGNGAADFMVVNTKVIQDFSKIKNFERNFKIESDDLLPLYGTFNGIDVYVCNLLGIDDTRVLVGRRGSQAEQNLKLLIQNLNEKVENNFLYSTYNLEKVNEPDWSNRYFTFYIQY
jgi:hypothetical protein